MAVPFFSLCKADPTVRSLLGGALPRIYPFGEAPQGVVKPYAVYQEVAGSPFNTLSCRPGEDRVVLQVDVYALKSGDSTKIAKAIRYAIEQDSYILAYRGEIREPETKAYRTSFDVDWIVPRD